MKVLAMAGVVSFGFGVASVAGPLDSPGTVYIDGTPCNLSCQSYMTWSRQILNANQAGTKGATKTAATKTLRERSGKRIPKRVEPATTNAPSRKSEDIQVTLSATPEPLPKSEIEVTPRNAEVRAPPALTSPSLEPRAVAKSETENASVSAGTSDSPRERTPKQLVMAALAVVEKITNAETPQGQGSEPTNGNKAGDPSISTPRIALLISRSDLKSASALKGLNVAIDAAQSAAEQDIRSALAAVGATETQILVSDVSPLDRLTSGDVQAAVVKLVSADAAEAFPDIKGFKVLRLPLSPR